MSARSVLKRFLGFRLPLQRHSCLYFWGFTEPSAQKELGKSCSQKKQLSEKVFAFCCATSLSITSAMSPEQKGNNWHFKMKEEPQLGRKPGLYPEELRSPLHRHLHAEEHHCRKQPTRPPHAPAPSPGLAVLLLALGSLPAECKIAFGPKSFCWRPEKAARPVLALHGVWLLQTSRLWRLLGRCLLTATDAPTRREQSKALRNKYSYLGIGLSSPGATFLHGPWEVLCGWAVLELAWSREQS